MEDLQTLLIKVDNEVEREFNEKILKEIHSHNLTEEKLINPKSWTTQDVIKWIKYEKLDDNQIIEAFTKNEIDGETLYDITETDIREELKVKSLKQRKNLFNAILKITGRKKEVHNYSFSQDELDKSNLFSYYNRFQNAKKSNDNSIFSQMKKEFFNPIPEERNLKGNKHNNVYIKKGKKFICDYCFNEDYFSTGVEILECECKVCSYCMRDLFFNAMNDFTLMPPKCHEIEIQISILDSIMDDHEKSAYLLKLKEFKCDIKLYCPNKKCSAFVFTDKNTHQFISCRECKTLLCTKCKEFGHIGKTCEESNLETINEKNLNLKLLKENGWSICGKCGLGIELDQGCNHMTCRYCKHEFCYVCGSEWPFNDTKCIKGCAVYSDKEETRLLKKQIQDFVDYYRRPITKTERDYLRKNINNSECKHELRYHQNLRRPSTCDNCGYYLKHYCYKCDNCRVDICRTCHFNRLTYYY